MSKTCDVCGEELGILNKFRYADGFICKACYAKASRHFTETIRNKKLTEIKVLCSKQRDLESFENFHVTGKIGNYLLVDENQKRICIPKNRMTNQKVSDPEFYDAVDIRDCSIIYGSTLSPEELEQKMMQRKSEETISYLMLRIALKTGFQKDITLLANPVRIKSFAFRRSYDFARRIKEEIDDLVEKTKGIDNISRQKTS